MRRKNILTLKNVYKAPAICVSIDFLVFLRSRWLFPIAYWSPHEILFNYKSADSLKTYLTDFPKRELNSVTSTIPTSVFRFLVFINWKIPLRLLLRENKMNFFFIKTSKRARIEEKWMKKVQKNKKKRALLTLPVNI